MSDKSEELPDTLSVDLKTIEKLWGIWTIWRATGRRFRPSELLQEDDLTVSVLLELDGVYSRVEAQMAEQQAAPTDEERLEKMFE